jgi:hypothetical protein
MSLNIKSPEAHELAAELARLTGESMTKAVTEAIRERLERERRKRDEDKALHRAHADRGAVRRLSASRPPKPRGASLRRTRIAALMVVDSSALGAAASTTTVSAANVRGNAIMYRKLEVQERKVE